MEHSETLSKFNLYSSEIGLYYLSELLKPIFIVVLAFAIVGFTSKFQRNENFFKILFNAVLIGFAIYILRELVNKFTISFNINFIYAYFIIFILPFIVGVYKTIQIEND